MTAVLERHDTIGDQEAAVHQWLSLLYDRQQGIRATP